MAQIIKVIGPPGTGKSHYLSRQVELATRKYKPNEIVVISYTNAAVEEIQTRIQSKIGVELPFVKTMHSICYKLLRLNNTKFAEQSKYIKEFNSLHPAFAFGMRSNIDIEGESTDLGNDKLMSDSNIMRNKLIPEERWNVETRYFYHAWHGFCQQNEIYSYTDMLEHVLMRQLYIDSMKVLFVDEAQDMTAMQMKILMLWSSNCDTVVMSGDSNQAIFKFAGASPEVFRDMKYDKKVELKKSYRLSENVLKYSNEIISNSPDRELIVFEPREKGGMVERGCTNIDLKIKGTHMILSRCQYQVRRRVQELLYNHIPFHNPYRVTDLSWNPFKQKIAESVRAYLKFLVDGSTITMEELMSIIDKCTVSKCFVGRGYKKKIQDLSKEDQSETYRFDSFDLKNLGFTEGFISGSGNVSEYIKFGSSKTDEMLEFLTHSNRSAFFDIPKVIVGTIHSVKGGESDNVWVETKLPSNIKRSMSESSESFSGEVRVAYVAVTRARSMVGIIGSNDIYD